MKYHNLSFFWALFDDDFLSSSIVGGNRIIMVDGSYVKLTDGNVLGYV